MITNILNWVKSINYLKLIPYGIIIVLLIILYFFNMRNNTLSDKVDTEVKFRIALLDTMKTYQNKYKEVENEKKSLQVSVKELNKAKDQLSESQKYLLERVNNLSKKYTEIAAALVETNVILDGLRNDNANVNKKDSTISFVLKTKDLEYNILVGNVSPSKISKPYLAFNDFKLPNKQIVDFHWKNDKKEGNPISFSVSNSNKYFNVVNIESYVIPELNKEVIKPTFWNKLGTVFKSTGGNVVYIGAGVGLGYLLFK